MRHPELPPFRSSPLSFPSSPLRLDLSHRNPTTTISTTTTKMGIKIHGTSIIDAVNFSIQSLQAYRHTPSAYHGKLYQRSDTIFNYKILKVFKVVNINLLITNIIGIFHSLTYFLLIVRKSNNRVGYLKTYYFFLPY